MACAHTIARACQNEEKNVKVIIHPPNGRQEYTNLPEREPADLVRQRMSERLGDPVADDRELLGAVASSQEQQSDAADDRAQHFEWSEAVTEELLEEEHSWKNTKW